MKQFTGMEYLKIDVANTFGLDKETWEDRIAWTELWDSQLETFAENAADTFLYAKAVLTLRDAQNNVPTGHLMGMDATASGLQIMACLIGCKTTAANVNLVNTGKRQDIYQKMSETMSNILGRTISRDTIKQPVMTTFYGSKAQPKSLFGEDTPELKAFYKTLDTELTGAIEVLNDIQSCWNPNVLAHSWTLPDGVKVNIKVMEPVSKKIEIDEMNHATFTHRVYVNMATPTGISLSSNIVHSIDAYIAREMIRRSHEQGFSMLTIHDNFLASPNHMNKVRQNYVNILAEIASSNLLQDILREVTNNPSLVYKKYSNDLAIDILKSEYALS
jgi:DNA-directed RNA polymerase